MPISLTGPAVWRWLQQRCVSALWSQLLPLAVLALLASQSGSLRARVAPPPEKAYATLSGQLGEARFTASADQSAIAWAPDGNSLATGGVDGTVSIWERSGRIRNRLPTEGAGVMALAYAPGGRYLCCGSVRGVLCVLDLEQKKRIATVQAHKELIRGLAVSKDGKQLISAGLDGVLRVWAFPALKLVRSFASKQTSKLRHVAAAADGSALAVGTADGKVHVWDAITGKLLWQADFDLSHLPMRTALIFSPDGKSLVMARRQSDPGIFRHVYIIQQRDAATGQILHSWREHFLKGLAFDAQGKLLARSTSGGELRLVRLADGLPAGNLMVWSDQETLAFSPDGKHIAAVTRSKVHLWELASGKELLPEGASHGKLLSITFLPDGKRLAALREDHHFTLWDTTTAKVLRRFIEPLRPGWAAVTYCPSRNLLARAVERGTIVVDDLDQGNRRTIQPENIPAVFRQLCLSPDGKWVAARSGGIWIWDTGTGNLVTEYSGRGRYEVPLQFSPDGEYLTGADTAGKAPFKPGDFVLLLLEARTGKEAVHFVGHKNTWSSLAFSPDGRFLASACHHHYVRVWEVATGKELWHIRYGKIGNKLIVSFSPDVRTVVTAMHDDGEFGPEREQVRFWHSLTGQRIGQFAANQNGVRCLAFCGDGKVLATGGADQTIRLWDVSRLHRDTQPTMVKLTPAQEQSLWQDLAADDAPRAYRAAWHWVAAGNQTIAYFRTRLRPPVRITAKEIDKLLADLQSEDGKTQEAAVTKLEGLRPEADEALHNALKETKAAEARQRLTAILEKPTLAIRLPDKLRVYRAIFVLEQIGSPEARNLLRLLAAGYDKARISIEAKRALQRLANR